MSSDKTVVLVTGSKAGIGKGLLAAYASRPNTIAIAAIRDGPDSSAASSLTSLPANSNGSKIVVVKYDASSQTAAKTLVSDLEKQHKITHLDIVIANAGILNHWGLAKDVSPENLQEHLAINTTAPITLYQGTRALLLKSKQTPKFFVISSNIGSVSALPSYAGMQVLAYGMSKASVNYAMAKIHQEEDSLVVVPVHPGWVKTTMGSKAANYVGMTENDVPVTIDQSVGGLLKVFDAATKEGHSGKFIDFEGKEVPW